MAYQTDISVKPQIWILFYLIAEYEKVKLKSSLITRGRNARLSDVSSLVLIFKGDDLIAALNNIIQ